MVFDAAPRPLPLAEVLRAKSPVVADEVLERLPAG